MGTFTWTSGTSGLWTSAGNWSPSQSPGTGDTVLVTSPGSYLISEPGNATVGTLILDNAAAAISVGGSLAVTDDLTITAGMLAVTGTLDATGLSNTGTIHNTGQVIVRGTVDAASLERIGGAGGRLAVLGTIENAGGTLDGSLLSGQFITDWGIVEGGTVVNVSNQGRATLDGVTWQGPLDILTSVTVENGLVLTGPGGTGTGTLNFTTLASSSWLEFVGDQSFDNVSVTGFGSVVAQGTLAIGSNFSMVGVPDNTPDSTNRIVFAGTGTILNYGTIIGYSSERITGTLSNDVLISIQAASFENFGVITGIDMSAPGTNVPGFIAHYFPGVTTTSITSTSFINHAGGIMEAGQSFGTARITVSASSSFINDGTMLTQGQGASVGGTIDIAAFLDGTGTIDLNGGGTVALRNAVGNAQTINFSGQGTLLLEQPFFMLGSITGFDPDDVIQLGTQATAVSYASGDLKLQIAGGQTLDLAITGAHDLSDFLFSTQGANTVIQLACFATGTRLATARGPVPVEALREGDMMILADGGPMLPVTWIGHRTVDLRSHPAPHKARPVRIAAGAFAPGVPTRDLYLSPDHAVFVDGMLIPVKFLLNQATIVQQAVERIRYWHVELPRHAVLLAEGLSVESLLPGSDRSAFANGGDAVALHPEFSAWSWDAQGCAPLVVTGPGLEKVRVALAHRARHLAPRRAA